MAELDQLVVALKNADAAGDEAAARKLAAAIRQRQSPPSVAAPAEPARPPARTVEDVEYRSPLAPLTSGLSSGLTFGFGDELGSAIRAGISAPFSEKTFGEIYADQLGQIRGEQAEAREQSPGMAMAGEILGGVVQGGGLAKGAKMLLPRLSSGQRLTAVGATEGGLFGAGTSDGGLGERAGNAAIGAGLGAILPVPLQAGASAIGRGAASLGRTAANTPQRQARRVVDRALEREGLAPDEALTRLQELGPEARLADLLPETARAATAIPGPAKQVARDFLEQRQAGQQGRLIETTGLGDVPEFKRAFQRFMNDRQSAASPLYDEAYAAPLDLTSPGMQALLKRPSMQQAMKEAQNILADEGGGTGHVRLMDAVKRHLDDKIGTAMRSGARDEARRLLNIKNALLAEVDRQVPAFAQARATYAGEAAMRDAGSLGRKMLTQKTDLDDVELAIQSMGQGERTAFQMGALRGMVDRIEGMGDTRNAAQKLVESPRAREVLRLAFPDEESLQRLIQTAEAESMFSRTRNTVRGGSPTARIQEDVSDLRGTAGIVGSIATGQYGQAVGQLLQKLGIGNVSDEALGEVAKILFGETPQQLSRRQLAPMRPILPPALTRRLPSPETVRGGVLGASGAVLAPDQRRQMMAEQLQR